MAIKYIYIFQSKAVQNLPKLGFFGLKTNHLETLPPLKNSPLATYQIISAQLFSSIHISG
jgi:hypothetical protein